MGTLTADERRHFADAGYVRVRDAFAPDAAQAMRDLVWRSLEARGVRRDDPSTWPTDAHHLQHLRGAPEFLAVNTARTFGAIDDLLGAGNWRHPRNWGAFFLNFPDRREWTVPAGPWHLDAPYNDPLTPVAGVKVHVVFGDIAPRAGGMTVVSGSHRLVARLMNGESPPLASTPAKTRKAIMRIHPWLRELSSDWGTPAQRIERFVEHTTEVNGVPVRVDELTGAAGDVVLIHPLLLHTRPVNAGETPRFLLNKDLRVRLH